MSFSTKSSVFSRKTRKQNFTVLVCGQSGLGKTSFINTIYGQPILDQESSATSLYFEQACADIEDVDDGTKVELTMIETVKFGTDLNNVKDINAVTDYIENKFDEVLAEESRIRRNPRFKDGRIDVCVYFIEPSSHGLNELDIIMLKQLSPIVNIVPVLARADQLTQPEKLLNKRLIREDLRMHDISVFEFKYEESIPEEDETGTEIEHAALQDEEVAAAVPFAVTSSSQVSADGVEYIRKLAFGSVDILDPEQTDFAALKQAVFNDFRLELKEKTHFNLYETYRTKQLDPQQTHRSSLLMPQELADHSARLKQAQLQREAQRLKEEDLRVNQEIERKRAQLAQREQELRELERRIASPADQHTEVDQLHDELAELEEKQAKLAKELSREIKPLAVGGQEVPPSE